MHRAKLQEDMRRLSDCGLNSLLVPESQLTSRALPSKQFHGTARKNPLMNPNRSLFGLPTIPALALCLLPLTACAPSDAPVPTPSVPLPEFLTSAEAQLMEAGFELSIAQWNQATNITDETTAAAAVASEKQVGLAVELANAAASYDAASATPEEARKVSILRGSITIPAPPDEAKGQELSQIVAGLESAYGSGQACAESGECRDLEQLEDVIETGDVATRLEAWDDWRTVSVAMKDDYARMVELANEGARELGYSDVGAMWRSGYDMEPDAFAAELDRLWEQVKPLYDALHCHVRAKLSEHYGADQVPAEGPIPAHLLGNMWAQTWSNVYDLVAPETSDAGYDLTNQLRRAGYDEEQMVRTGERFFTSLGFDPLPETFWERSLIKKPDDRQVVCHASAWHMDLDQDVRLKQCVEINAEDFSTVHHELGHNYYQLAYREQDVLFRDSANDGFHEAVGDTLALSVTPGYLKDLGLIDQEPPASADLGLLMRMALDKVAFLPFGLMVDQWRWGAFSGEIPVEEWNDGWWELREKYQGVGAPNERPQEAFDPGAKYHVPANTPYTRYFLAHILQFQFHRELCAAAGYEGALNRCSIYGNEAAGEKLRNMLAMGRSQPWPDALEALSGSRDMDATAIISYFAPLKTWLDEQNEGRVCGW